MVTLPLSDITALKTGSFLPGKYVWGKLAFNINTRSHGVLGFAVADSIGARWQARLRAPSWSRSHR